MSTQHHVVFADARAMDSVASRSVALVVTSPPYPMIEMWDGTFAALDPSIGSALAAGDGTTAYERMHCALEPVWAEVARVLIHGGLACVNIGDATRTLGDRFALYPNHARIVADLQAVGLTALPLILWRKQTNAPNKFMGSGMLPAGAYVTLEHEYIVIVRKGGKRGFLSDGDKRARRESAYFWEERNSWFSDVWFDLKGSRQRLGDGGARERSGAFPFELAYRLISMFSVRGDTVLDPFAGTGTTLLAAMATGRSSVGFEIDRGLLHALDEGARGIVEVACARVDERLAAHDAFLRERFARKGPFRHRNVDYGFPVITRHETELRLDRMSSVERTGEASWEAFYEKGPGLADRCSWDGYFAPEDSSE